MRLKIIAALVATSMSWETSAAVPAVDGVSPYLFVFASDEDNKSEDFFLVLDLRSSAQANPVVATVPVGAKNSMPHHLEYDTPPRGPYCSLTPTTAKTRTCST